MFNHEKDTRLLIVVHSRLGRPTVGIQALFALGLTSKLQQVRIP